MPAATPPGQHKHGDRAIILDADAMGRLRKELIWTLGVQRARAVMTRFGYAMGYGEAVRWRDLCDDDMVWLARAHEALAANGLAKVLPADVSFDRSAGVLNYTAEVLDSFEVHEQSGHLGSATATEACWILTGFLSGFASAFLGDEVYFQEHRCAVAGARSCEVVGRTRAQWGARAASLAGLFEEENIGNELTIVYDELSRKNEELQQAVAILKAQQEATPDGVLIVDLGGRVLSYNSRFLRLWGIPEEMARRGDDEALLGFVLQRLKDPDGFLATVRYLYDHPLESRQDDVIEFHDGTIVQRATVPVLRADSQPSARAWYFRDITAQRRLETEFRQSQKMEAVGRLAGGIAHDFNNLLTAIGGHIDLVGKGLDPADTGHDSLRVASAAVQRASELTRGLLNFSRQTPPTPRPLLLSETITETLRLIRRTFDPRIEIETHAGEGLWTICADPGQIQQVLTNLCVNARDAMPDGGRLAVRASNATLPAGSGPGGVNPAGDYVVLTVSDTGTGMSPEVQARMFDPFFTTKEIGKGTGLGLAMVYGIVEQHGASIRCESAPGRGTTFSILFARARPVASRAAGEAQAPVRGGAETVLLVEDEQVVRELSARILAGYGYRVLAASDGLQAVEVLRENAADIRLVVLDMLMPRRSGRETFLDIRSISPTVPVLICSGYGLEKHMNELSEHPPVGSLPKPFRPAALARMVREMLDASSPAA